MGRRSSDDNEARARLTVDLLLQAEPSTNNKYLLLASRIAFPIEHLEDVKDTFRFRASFAIEVLRKALISRESRESITRRYSHAIAASMDWVNSFEQAALLP